MLDSYEAISPHFVEIRIMLVISTSLLSQDVKLSRSSTSDRTVLLYFGFPPFIFE